MSEQRFYREDPERTEPIRNFSSAFRSSSGEDFVTSGVRMGYKLVEDQLRRGQRAARQMSNQLQSSRPDLRELTDRVLHFYGDLYTQAVLFWFDLGTGAIPLFEDVLGDVEEEMSGGKSAASAGFMPVEIASLRPVRVKLNLQPGSERFPLDAVQPRARDDNKPPLMNVSFDQGVLAIRVPDDQPADVYYGVVCNRDSGEPLGTLSVEIRAS
jgi:hypothetical protein